MNTFGWDQITYWWDEKQGDEGDLWHRALLDPPLLRLAGDVRGLHVLDLACGNGYLSRRFAREGAIVTIDAMGTQTKIAQQIIEQEGNYALARKRQSGKSL